jgi:hypothetical protein
MMSCRQDVVLALSRFKRNCQKNKNKDGLKIQKKLPKTPLPKTLKIQKRQKKGTYLPALI